MVPRRLALIAALTASLATADEHWIRIKSGPLEVMTPNGERPARQQMFEAEQFRYVVGLMIGVQDPITVWPIRTVVRKGARPSPPVMGRDSWISSAPAGEPSTPEWRKACARILIDDNTGHMPPNIENGLITFLSTLEMKGVRLTLGVPPPAAERTRDWARIHLFATQPEYSGRLHILLSNIAHGANYDAACRNAFEKPAVEMDKRVDAYFAAGRFDSVPYPGRALSERDFTVRDLEPYDGRIALADLLLADPSQSAQAATAYQALTGPEAQEGLALLAARRKDPTAPKLFESATKAGSKNPRAWLGTGTHDGAIKAIELNPKWPDPHIRLAELATAPNVKAVELSKAAALARRDVELWKRAALACEDANQFKEAAKDWAAAEDAAATDAQREQLRQARIESAQKRADFDAAERKRLADEEARDLERVKNASLAEIRAAETKANKEMQAGGAVPQKPVEWWDGPGGPAETAAGQLMRVDCLAGGRAKLTIETAPKKTMVLMIRDPGKITIMGTGELSLGCGVQRPARSVSVEYTPARDAKLGTAGDVRTVEFK